MPALRTSLLLPLTLAVLLLPSAASAEETCQGRLFALSYRLDEFKKLLPDGTEWKASEHSVGLCVDPAVKHEVAAALQSGRVMSEKAAEDLRVAIQEGKVLLRTMTATAGDLGTGAVEIGRAMATRTVDLSGEAWSLLATGGSWAWQATIRPAHAAPMGEPTNQLEPC